MMLKYKLLAVLTLLVGLLIVMPADASILHAYGDSVTAATSTGDSLNPDGTSGYLYQYRNNYYNYSGITITVDGFSGKTSDWGLQNIGSEGNHSMFVYMFGINDQSNNMTATQTANNYIAMYQFLAANVSNVGGSVILPMMPNTVTDDGVTPWRNITNQSAYILSVQSQLDAAKIPHFGTYDTMDQIPYDGIPESPQAGYMCSDGIHPSIDGHAQIALGMRRYFTNATSFTDNFDTNTIGNYSISNNNMRYNTTLQAMEYNGTITGVGADQAMIFPSKIYGAGMYNVTINMRSADGAGKAQAELIFAQQNFTADSGTNYNGNKYNIMLSTSSNGVFFYNTINSTLYSLASNTTPTINLNTPYTISAKHDPLTGIMVVYLNDQYMFNVTNMSHVGGNVGFGTNRGYWITFDNLTVTAAPSSSFGVNTTSGYTTQAVQFTDTSTNTPKTWQWGYKDTAGNNTWINGPTTKNPVISFGVGTWSVNLTSSNDGGLNTSTQSTTITVQSPASPRTGISEHNNNLKLLMENNESTFADVMGHPVTVSGATLSTTTKKFGAGSLYSASNGQVALLADSTDWSFGNGNFTIHLWDYPTTDASAIFVIGQSDSTPSVGSRSWQLYRPVTSYGFYFYASNGTPYTLSASSTSAKNTWHQVDITRAGDTLYLYIDGVLNGTQYVNGITFQDGTGKLGVGAFGEFASSAYGYVDDVAIWNVSIPESELSPQGSEILNKTAASFTTNTTGGVSPLPVLLTDTSTNTPTAWAWGAKNLTPGNNTWISLGTTTPLNTVLGGGNWSVNLTASNIGGSNISSSTWINVSASSYVTTPILSQFASNTSIGYAYPWPVQFTDNSAGSPTTWNWTFGDTYTSTATNPLHIYTVAGAYTVSLNVTNSTGSYSVNSSTVTLQTDNDVWLRSWLPFENATVVDLKGVAWTNNGGVLSAPGRFGNQSLYLSGNNYISSPSSSIWDRSSIAGEQEAWYYITSYGDAGKAFFRRSSGTNGHANGWGMFNINGTANGNAFWYGNGATNYTTPFTIPLNTWTHVALVRDTDQYWRVYVNGVLWGTPVYMGGLQVDTTNPMMIGSSGPGTEPSFYIAEWRYTQGVPRFVYSPFSTPYAAYRGSLTGGIDPNPNSTFRYKVNPEDYLSAIIWNQSYGGTRNRTMQIQNVTTAKYVSGAFVFDPVHESGLALRVNTSTYTDLVLESSSIDNTAGTATFNVSRGGLNMSSLFDNRTSLVDLQLLYHTYSPDPIGVQYFAYGWIIDGGSYPVHNFIETNMTYGMWGTPIINFAANTTTPTTSSAVQFTDSTGNYPTAWSWDFGDGTTSTLQNPLHVYTTTGLKSVTLTAYLAANTSITNTSTKTNYIDVVAGGSAPVAAFSATPLTTTIGNAVTFSDMTTNNPTSWTWTFGDSSGSNLQNPTHAYSALGLYTVNLTVSSLNGTSTISKTNYINITNTTPTGLLPVDVVMDPSYVFMLHITDSSTGNAIPDVTLLDSNGNTFTTTNGTFVLTYPYSAIVFYLTSTGYVSKSASFIIDSDQTQTVQMVASTTTSQNTWWTPHTVQITVMSDTYATRLPGVTISAAYNESAMPTDWIQTLYGIRQSAQADMVNSTLSLGGVTGSDGTLTTTMLGSLKYDFYLTSSTYGLSNYHVQAYPSDSMLNIYVPVNGQVLPTAGNSTYVYLNNTRLYITQPNISYVSLCIDYQDLSGTTTSVTEKWWYGANKTVFYTASGSNPGTTKMTNCSTIPNVRGTSVYWNWSAVNSI